MKNQQHRLALHGRFGGQIGDLEDFDQPVELLDDLLDIGRVDHEGHAAHVGRFAGADRQALDIEAAAAEQADDAVQHAGAVLHQGNDGMGEGQSSPFRFCHRGWWGFGHHLADTLVDRHHREDVDFPLDTEVDHHRAVVVASPADRPPRLRRRARR